MKCADISSCLNEIRAYCERSSLGYALLINTENYDEYQNLLSMMEADNSKKVVRVSDYCCDESLPKIDEIINDVGCSGDYVLVGLSQRIMLEGLNSVKRWISLLLQMQVHGHLIVLLEHCDQYLHSFIRQDRRVDRRILLLNGEKSHLPTIKLAKNESLCIGEKTKKNIKELFVALEKITLDVMKKSSEITVVTQLSTDIFKNSIYSVSEYDSAYKNIREKYPDIAAKTKESYGTDEQWYSLAQKLHKYGSLSTAIQKMFGTVANLSVCLRDCINFSSSEKLWYLWIGMKVMGVSGQPYLAKVIANTQNVNQLEKDIYIGLLEYSSNDSDFKQLYYERKQLVSLFPENFKLIDLYCTLVGKYEKEAIKYLTDLSEKEATEFMRCLSIYDYTEQEILDVTEVTFPEIHEYLQEFVFTSANSKLSEQEAYLRAMFTGYFKEYKVQKIKNSIDKEFLVKVENVATKRPYNCLPNRISVVKKKVQPTAKIFFFDALGVEYLSYIQSKCEKYGMIADIQIARCELPSITENNKDFVELYDEQVVKINELDELKHHSQKIDYRNCKLPVHLFQELKIIDSHLRRIQSGLLQGQYDNAVIVSDHGASRLAVIYEHESQSILSLDEKAENSGRCCISNTDPDIPFVTFENGYAVLANYDRFKGGRKANVEVHGGASLEEVLVPIIVLTKRPEKLYVCFINPVVEIKPRELAKITLFSNMSLKNPQLHVNGKIYDGEILEDNRHFIFAMPDLKRSRNFVADVYDGNKKIASNLSFRIQTTVAKANDRMLI